nr:hypothetical protein [Tanacetum cinerariifolium]
MHQFWNTIKKIGYSDAYNFKLDKKKCRVDTEVFHEILQICPILRNQEFVELPSKENLLSFIKELGYSGNYDMLSAIYNDQMHQPWRTLDAIINRCISGKTIVLDRQKCTNLVGISLHTVHDDSMLGILKFVSKIEGCQRYGALIPDGMINEDIKLSKAYKTYLDYATGKVPPKKARKFKKPASLKLTTVPTLPKEPTEKSNRVKRPTKKSTTVLIAGVVIRDTFGVSVSIKKASAKADRGKGIELLSDAALLEDTQLKKALKKSKRETHKLQVNGSSEGADFELEVPDEPTSKSKDTSEGTGVNPRVPDVSKEDSFDSDNESWGNSEDESDNDNDEDDNDDESGNDDDGDEYVHTPKNDESDDDEMMDEEKEDDVTKELYEDLNINLGNQDADMTNAEQGREDQHNTSHDSGFVQEEEDAHVTLTTVHDKTEGLMQSSSLSSDYTSKLLTLNNPSPYVNGIASLMTTATIPPPPPPVNPSPQQTTLTTTSTTFDATTSILMDKIEENKSYLIADYKKELYDALVTSYNTNKDLFDSYGEVFMLKRSREDKDKDQDPIAGSDRRTERSQERNLSHLKAQSQKNLSLLALLKSRSLSLKHLVNLCKQRNQCLKLQTQRCNKIKGDLLSTCSKAPAKALLNLNIISKNVAKLSMIDLIVIIQKVMQIRLTLASHYRVCTLSKNDLKDLVNTYRIPLYLHPRLLDHGFTMEHLPAGAIGIYSEFLWFSGVIVPFLTFILSVLKYFKTRDWFSFSTCRNTEDVCMDDGPSSLKKWKHKFFLIDRRAILDYLTWRHSCSCVFEDLPTDGYDRNDVERLCACLIRLREMREEVFVRSGLSYVWFNKECDRSSKGLMIMLAKIVEESHHLFLSLLERVPSHTTAPTTEGAIILLPTPDEIVASLPNSRLVKKSKGPSQASRPSKKRKLQKKASEAGSIAPELDQAEGADEADLADLCAEIEDSLKRDEGISTRVISAPTRRLRKRFDAPSSITVVSAFEPSYVGTRPLLLLLVVVFLLEVYCVVASGRVGKFEVEVIRRQMDPLDCLARSALAHDAEYDQIMDDDFGTATCGEEIDLTLFPLSPGPYHMPYPYEGVSSPLYTKEEYDGPHVPKSNILCKDIFKDLELELSNRVNVLSALLVSHGYELNSRYTNLVSSKALLQEKLNQKKGDDRLLRSKVTSLDDKLEKLKGDYDALGQEDRELCSQRDVAYEDVKKLQLFTSDDFHAALARVASLNINYGVERGLRMGRIDVEFEAAVQKVSNFHAGAKANFDKALVDFPTTPFVTPLFVKKTLCHNLGVISKHI